MKFNRTHITHGLLVKIVKACQLSMNEIVRHVKIKNRKGEVIMTVWSCIHKGKQKFIVSDNHGTNLAGLIEHALTWKPDYNVNSGIVNFIKSRLVWNFETKVAL